MDGACRTYAAEEKCIQCFGGKYERKRQLEHTGVDGRIILKWILKNG
jgi:hypothetical protein